jgi:hypothetical protein
MNAEVNCDQPTHAAPSEPPHAASERLTLAMRNAVMRQWVADRFIPHVRAERATLTLDTVALNDSYDEQFTWRLHSTSSGHRDTRLHLVERAENEFFFQDATCSCGVQAISLATICVHAAILLHNTPGLVKRQMLQVDLPLPTQDAGTSDPLSGPTLTTAATASSFEPTAAPDTNPWRARLAPATTTLSPLRLHLVLDASRTTGALHCTVKHVSRPGAIAEAISYCDLTARLGAPWQPEEVEIARWLGACRHASRAVTTKAAAEFEVIDAETASIVLELARRGRCVTPDGQVIRVVGRAPAEWVQWVLVNADTQKLKFHARTDERPLLSASHNEPRAPIAALAQADATMYVLEAGSDRLRQLLLALKSVRRSAWTALRQAWAEQADLASFPSPGTAESLVIDTVDLPIVLEVHPNNAAQTGPGVAIKLLYLHEGKRYPISASPPRPTYREGRWTTYSVSSLVLERLKSTLVQGMGWRATNEQLIDYTKTSDRHGVAESFYAEQWTQLMDQQLTTPIESHLPIAVVSMGEPVLPIAVRPECQAHIRDGWRVALPHPLDRKTTLDLVRLTPLGSDRYTEHGSAFSALYLPMGMRPEQGTFYKASRATWDPVFREIRQQFEELERAGIRSGRILRASLLAPHRPLPARITQHEAFASDLARIKSLPQRIADAMASDAPAMPSTFKADLPRFQHDAVAWALTLIDTGFGGVLADDRGLGKTVESLAIIAARRHVRRERKLPQRPSVIVVEPKELHHWERHLQTILPRLKCFVAANRAAVESLKDAASIDVLVMPYSVARSQTTWINKLNPELVFMDEATVAKNPNSKTWEALNSLSNACLFPITGTPIDRNAGDLWSLLELAAPGLISKGEFSELAGSTASPERDRLRKRIAPFVLRRLKADVAEHLPDKHQIIQYITLEPSHAKHYEARRMAARNEWNALRRQHGFSQAVVGARHLFNTLRQHAAGEVKPTSELLTTGKTSYLRAMLDEIIPAGCRVLVFTESLQESQELARALNAVHLRAAAYDGTREQRDQALVEFKAGMRDILCVSATVGASGLDCPECDTVIVLHPWLNLGRMDQMGDRAHRLITKHDVSVYWLVSADTIESVAMGLLERYQRTAGGLLDDGHGGAGGTLSLTEFDVEQMLEASPMTTKAARIDQAA